MEETSALKNFFSANFHEDCLEDYGTWQEIVDQYAADFDAETIKATVGELQCFLEKPQSDEELREKLLRKLGCYYAPPGPAALTRPWLEEVLTRLRASAV